MSRCHISLRTTTARGSFSNTLCEEGGRPSKGPSPFVPFFEPNRHHPLLTSLHFASLAVAGHSLLPMLLSDIDSVALLSPPKPFLVFCFFNLIMALIYVSSGGGSRPSGSAPDDRGGLESSPKGVEKIEEVVGDTEGPGEDDGDGNGDAGNCRVGRGPEGTRGICQLGDEEASDGAAGDCEELNRRAEEFIVRMNRAWVAEREASRASAVIGGEQLIVGDSLAVV